MAKILGPLGLLETVTKSTSAATIQKLRAVEDLDLADEKANYLSYNPSKVHEIDTIERELKRFFTLFLLEPNPEYDFAPSGIIDGLWHELILNTPKYRKFCNDLNGNYIDHMPSSTISSGRAKVSGEIYGYTKSVLERFYGGITPFVWGESARCDSAHECIIWIER